MGKQWDSSTETAMGLHTVWRVALPRGARAERAPLLVRPAAPLRPTEEEAAEGAVAEGEEEEEALVEGEAVEEGA